VPSVRVGIAAGTVAIGFLLGVAPSATVPAHVAPSGLSLFYGFLSSLFIAFHAVLIKSSLPYCHNSTIQLAYWTNLGSALFLFPFVLLHREISTLEDLVHDSNWDGQVFLWGSIVTGIFGFLLCIAGLLSIKVTSPITHMFSSVSHMHCIQKIDVTISLPPGLKICYSNPVRCLAIQRHHDGVCTWF
jgi:GDP-fucose transporter C1